MKAAFVRNRAVLVGDMPDPVPTTGQSLVRTRNCGTIIATDSHAPGRETATGMGAR